MPLIVRGPGVKPNSWCHVRVVGFDFLPTFCEWAGVPTKSLPASVEGGSIAGLLVNDGRGDVRRLREELVFHFPHYQSDDGPQSAIFVGDLKLMHFYEDDRDALFDLSNDLGEHRDLSKERPADTARLRKQLAAYLHAVDAQLATPNPNYDSSRSPPPSRPQPGGRKSGGKQNKKDAP